MIMLNGIDYINYYNDVSHTSHLMGSKLPDYMITGSLKAILNARQYAEEILHDITAVNEYLVILKSF